MTIALAVLTGVVAATLGALLAGNRPARRRPSSARVADPVRRELADLREDLVAGDLTGRDYHLLRDRLAARIVAGSRPARAPGGRPASRWRWPLAGAAAAAIIVATLIPALHDRSAGGYSSGNDFADKQSFDSGTRAWRAAERAVVASDFASAIRSYRVAVAFLPSQPELRARFGFALAQAGRIGEAEQQLRHAVRAQRRLPDARLYLGAVLLRSGQRQEAARQWRVFLRLAPRGQDARLVRRTLRRLP